MKRVRLKKSSAPPPPAAPIRLFLGDASFELASPSNVAFYQRLRSTLRHIPDHWGMRLPEIELCHDGALPPGGFHLTIAGESCGQGVLAQGRLLALGEEEALGSLLGELDLDPVYGLPAKWILPSQGAQAGQLGLHLLEPETILLTLLIERLPRRLDKLFTFEECEAILESWRSRTPALVEEALRRHDLGRWFRLFRSLLREGVALARIDRILEGALRSQKKRPGSELTELARQALGWEICQGLLDGREVLPAIVLAQWVEKRWIAELRSRHPLDDWFFRRFAEALAYEVEDAWSQGFRPVLVVDARLRGDLASMLERTQPGLAVLSWAEIPSELDVETVATVGERLHPLAYRWRTQTFEVKPSNRL